MDSYSHRFAVPKIPSNETRPPEWSVVPPLGKGMNDASSRRNFSSSMLPRPELPPRCRPGRYKVESDSAGPAVVRRSEDLDTSVKPDGDVFFGAAFFLLRHRLQESQVRWRQRGLDD